MSPSHIAHLARSALQFGQDGMRLLQLLAKNRLQQPKSVLLDAARRHDNRAAVSILRVDQQVNLIRYAGLSSYVQQHVMPRLSWGGRGGGSVSTMSTSTADDGGKARVAFMITTSMKSDLTDKLGYTADDIKTLTPIEASLILNNNIKPEDKESVLPGMIAKYEAEQELQRKAELEDLKERERQAEEQRLAQAKAAAAEPKEADCEPSLQTQSDQNPSKSSSTPNESLVDTASAFLLKNVLAEENSKASGFADKSWYEVVELSDDGTTWERRGLHTNLDEANLSLDTRQSIAESKGVDTKFEVRSVAVEDL